MNDLKNDADMSKDFQALVEKLIKEHNEMYLELIKDIVEEE